jgi:hypothetical protein
VGGQTLHREKEIERKKTRIPKKKKPKIRIVIPQRFQKKIFIRNEEGVDP